MRERHELGRGVICEKCLKTATKDNYKRIATLQAVPNNTTGLYKTINRMNLCNDCYKKYTELLNKNFL